MLKVSALEIYNEIVKDLLNPDSGPLRLLDDPDVSSSEALRGQTQRSFINPTKPPDSGFEAYRKRPTILLWRREFACFSGGLWQLSEYSLFVGSPI